MQTYHTSKFSQQNKILKKIYSFTNPYQRILTNSLRFLEEKKNIYQQEIINFVVMPYFGLYLHMLMSSDSLYAVQNPARGGNSLTYCCRRWAGSRHVSVKDSGHTLRAPCTRYRTSKRIKKNNYQKNSAMIFHLNHLFNPAKRSMHICM